MRSFYDFVESLKYIEIIFGNNFKLNCKWKLNNRLLLLPKNSIFNFLNVKTNIFTENRIKFQSILSFIKSILQSTKQKWKKSHKQILSLFKTPTPTNIWRCNHTYINHFNWGKRTRKIHCETKFWKAYWMEVVRHNRRQSNEKSSTMEEDKNTRKSMASDVCYTKQRCLTKRREKNKKKKLSSKNKKKRRWTWYGKFEKLTIKGIAYM